MSGKLPVECFEMTSKDFCSTNPAHVQNDLLNAWRKKDITNFLSVLSSNECDPNFLYENDNYMRLLDSAVENGKRNKNLSSNLLFKKLIIITVCGNPFR